MSIKARGMALDAEQLEFPGLGQHRGRYGLVFMSKKRPGQKMTEWYVTESERDTAASIMRSQGREVSFVRR